MQTIKTEIQINASANTVWDILMNFSEFSQWNSFIRNIEGEAKEGSRVKVKLGVSEEKTMTFNPVVKIVRPQRQFTWLGNLIIPGLFDGEHSFELEAITPNQTRFIHQETFRGLLVPLFSKMLIDTHKSFERMNQDLKQRAESL